jgi:hypothetical protein
MAGGLRDLPHYGQRRAGKPSFGNPPDCRRETVKTFGNCHRIKIERYISVMVVLGVGLFLVNASWPEAAFAQTQASAATTCVQPAAPVNTWCVPATAGAGVLGTFCSTSAPVSKAHVRSADNAWDVLGSILAVPFVAAQCLLTRCP